MTKKPRQFPNKMLIPPDRANVPGLVLISNQWRRLKDGSIEAIFNSQAELDLCVMATKAIRESGGN